MSPLKRLTKRALGCALLVPRNRRLIWIYHDISDPDSPGFRPEYSTPTQMFCRQVDWLSRKFELVSLEQILDPKYRGSHKRPLASITFDDGFASVLTTADPVLRARKIPYSIFVNRDAVERDSLANAPDGSMTQGRSGLRAFLTGEELRALLSQGVLLGSHSASHAMLAQCDDTRLENEIRGNQFFLEGLCGKPSEYFAVPYGKRRHFDERTLTTALASGHRVVFSSVPQTFTTRDLGPGFLVIPRIGVTGETPAQLCFLANRALLPV